MAIPSLRDALASLLSGLALPGCETPSSAAVCHESLTRRFPKGWQVFPQVASRLIGTAEPDSDTPSKRAPLSITPELNLLIDGLPATVTESDIAALLSCCGTVVAVEIVMDTDGLPLGIARVTMTTKEEVRFAIQTYHRYQFRGRTLLVFEDATKSLREEVWNSRRANQP